MLSSRATAGHGLGGHRPNHASPRRRTGPTWADSPGCHPNSTSRNLSVTSLAACCTPAALAIRHSLFVRCAAVLEHDNTTTSHCPSPTDAPPQRPLGSPTRSPTGGTNVSVTPPASAESSPCVGPSSLPPPAPRPLLHPPPHLTRRTSLTPPASLAPARVNPPVRPDSVGAFGGDIISGRCPLASLRARVVGRNPSIRCRGSVHHDQHTGLNHACLDLDILSTSPHHSVSTALLTPVRQTTCSVRPSSTPPWTTRVPASSAWRTKPGTRGHARPRRARTTPTRSPCCSSLSAREHAALAQSVGSPPGHHNLQHTNRVTASADRRPVDPPPIVELKIFEGHEHNRKDVTFSTNANYFLFATLEQARKVATARGMPADRSLTVLTGTPVAGMVYLDRPHPAGYFIFPDLSVRHEGWYRLSFSLYEELKDAKDEDQMDDQSSISSGTGSHVTHRLEVKSVPFQVFSAKKFPGLTESTSLSRTVAEQGCRVRIRRDVRMRKRDAKGGKDWEGYEEATADDRARMSATPEVSGYAMANPHAYPDPMARSRSESNASHRSLALSLHLSRRTSTHEMNQGHHPSAYATSPHTPAYPQSSPYGPAQSPSYAQTSFMQPSAMQPPPPQYSQQSYPSQHAGSHSASSAAPSQQNYYGYSSAPPPPAVADGGTSQHQFIPPPPPSSYEHHGSFSRSSMDYTNNYAHAHRGSTSQYSAAPPPPAVHNEYTPHATKESYPATNGNHHYQPPPPPPRQPSYTSQLSGSSFGHKPAPLEPVQPPTSTTGASTPLTGRSLFDHNSKLLPPINTFPILSHLLEASSPASNGPITGFPPTSATAHSDSHKRGYSQVFRDDHLSRPLRQGARPSTPGHHFTPSFDVDDVDTEQYQTADGKSITYRRANGDPVNRPMQQHN